jgi:hypothetical protein
MNLNAFFLDNSKNAAEDISYTIEGLSKITNIAIFKSQFITGDKNNITLEEVNNINNNQKKKKFILKSSSSFK